MPIDNPNLSSAVAIIGAGGHAVSVASVASACGLSVVAFVDDQTNNSPVSGIPVITKQCCFEQLPTDNFVVAIGDNKQRASMYEEIRSFLPRAKFPVLIHGSAVIGVNTTIGEGTVIMPLANVGPNSNIGRFCIINTSSSLDHDCRAEDFSSLAPKAVTAGFVRVGAYSALSMGVSVMQGVSIGRHVIIGANSYVNKSIVDDVVAYGIPCRVVRLRPVAGENVN